MSVLHTKRLRTFEPAVQCRLFVKAIVSVSIHKYIHEALFYKNCSDELMSQV
jgi:hypothetical protein